MVKKKRASAESAVDDCALLRVRRNAVSLAVTAALAGALALPAAALAQDAEDDDEASSRSQVIDEVITYGTYRQSLIDSIGTKRNASSIVESVSAEDIGKLPDSSIAEAISRLPGLAGQRLDGRQSSISIRGLGENFSTATLNGREQVSIGDNRGIEFDLYPSEIMAGVTVYKTPDASLMNQGIAGTINLITVRPLDYDRTLQVNAHLEQNGHDQLNPDGDDSGYRATVSYIDQFADGTVGLALAVATMESPNQEERWNSWGFPGDDVTGDLILGGAKPFVRSSTLNRDTIMGVLEFEPTSQLSITADALYIDFSDEKRLRGIELPGEWGAGGADAIVSENGLVTQGVFNNVRGQIRNDFERRDAELNSFGLNIDYEISDIWGVEFDYSTGSVDRTVWSLESYSGMGRSSDATVMEDDIGFTMDTGNQGAIFSPTLDYSDDTMVNLGGAQGWGNGVTVPNDAQDGFINIPVIDDELTQIRLSTDLIVDTGFFTAFEGGLFFSDREKSKFDDGLFLTLPSYPGVSAIPSQYRLPDVSLDFIGMGNMVAYDSFQFWADGGYNEISERDTVASRWQNTWTVQEDVTIAYAMGDFNVVVGEMDINGNIGLQYVQTDQFSTGFATDNDDVTGLVIPQAVSGGDDYSEVLPSLNVIVNVTEEQLVRFGAARTMSRSRMDRMNASYGVEYIPNPTDGIFWRANGSNPGLRPQMADQFDLTYEYYFANDGYVGVAYFFKDLKDWQVQIEEPFDFSGITIPGGGTPPTTQGLINYWQNSEGGEVSGWELQGALPLGEVSQALEGLGIVASATFIDSSIDINGNEVQVPGLSEEVYNITLYYERGGFEARVSGSIREDFLGEVSAISFSRELVSVQSTEIWDAQISYDFVESDIEWLQGLKIMLQAQNLTDEPFVTFRNDDPRQIRDYQDYGRNFLLGASYEFN